MKIVGIVGRTYYNKDSQKIIQFNELVRKYLLIEEQVIPIGILPTENIDYVENEIGKNYINEEKLKKILDLCDGFVLPGGSYWQIFDEYIVHYAIKKNKPILGICLGFQTMCSMFAKNRVRFDMTRKLENETHYGKSNKYIHQVKIEKKSLLYDILQKETILVNSVHHDVIDFEMKDLVILARSPDGIIEAVTLPNHKFFLGVQWHPECLLDKNSLKILASFGEKL